MKTYPSKNLIFFILLLAFPINSPLPGVGALKGLASSIPGLPGTSKPKTKSKTEKEVDPTKEVERLQGQAEQDFKMQMTDFNRNLGRLTRIY